MWICCLNNNSKKINYESWNNTMHAATAAVSAAAHIYHWKIQQRIVATTIPTYSPVHATYLRLLFASNTPISFSQRPAVDRLARIQQYGNTKIYDLFILNFLYWNFLQSDCERVCVNKWPRIVEILIIKSDFLVIIIEFITFSLRFTWFTAKRLRTSSIISFPQSEQSKR